MAISLGIGLIDYQTEPLQLLHADKTGMDETTCALPCIMNII